MLGKRPFGHQIDIKFSIYIFNEQKDIMLGLYSSVIKFRQGYFLTDFLI